MGRVELEEGEAGEVRLSTTGSVVDGCMHGSAQVVAGEQIHPAVADDRWGGELLEHPSQARLGAPALAGTAAGSHAGAGAVGSVSQMEQVGALGVIELQSSGDRIQDRDGYASDRAPFKLRVVLHADSGKRSDLAAAQPRNPACADVGHPRLLRGDSGSPRDQELPDLRTVVHS